MEGGAPPSDRLWWPDILLQMFVMNMTPNTWIRCDAHVSQDGPAEPLTHIIIY